VNLAEEMTILVVGRLTTQKSSQQESLDLQGISSRG
jgi:hypothetical protein